MDRAPDASVEVARAAIEALEPPVELRRLRLRQAGGKAFVDVVIGVSPDAAVGQGHAVADRVEQALERVLPGTDAVVHVEPREEEGVLRERVRAAAATVPGVREIHNLTVLELDDRIEVALHLKLPGDLPFHDCARGRPSGRGGDRRRRARGDGRADARRAARRGGGGRGGPEDPGEIESIVRSVTGRNPRETRFLHTDDGLVVFLTLGLDARHEARRRAPGGRRASRSAYAKHSRTFAT